MTDDLWLAPCPDAPIHATVSLPGSKSLTNRALILSALARTPSLLSRPLVARDTQLMVTALRALGVGIEDAATGWRVTPARLTGPAAVDCGLAGTVMRFVPPVAALADGPVTFDGDPYARSRPMATILSALADLGVDVQDAGRGALPFTIEGRGCVRGGAVTIDASASSQFVSALLLAGARYERGVDVCHDGKPVPSVPHIDMTISQLRARGVEVDDSQPNRWVVAPGEVRAFDVYIEPDLSNAGPFVAAPLVTGGRCEVADWPVDTDQPGAAWRWILTELGATVTHDGSTLVIEAERGSISAVALDLHDAGELTPVVAALCAYAAGTCVLSGIGHLRGHETDRLAAIAAQICGLGGRAEEAADGLVITPAALTGGRFATYSDHRMAHAGAVLGLGTPGVLVEDVETTAKTFPGFATAWEGFVS